MKLRIASIYGFLICHLVAALAFVPWFFSWTGVVLFAVGCIVFGVFGINIGYHRLLTHRGFSSPRWLERIFVVCGVCAFQDEPGYWVAMHRKHHQYSDEEEDPHSPIVSFFWAHMGWLVMRHDNRKRQLLIEQYAKDVIRDPLYAWLGPTYNWVSVVAVSWLLYFYGGFGVAFASGASLLEAIQFGFSLVVWGAALRTVVVWHLTWSVNSVTHVWGYRNYDTPDVSRNNALVALLVSGEGWHNNHHADPRSAMHGHQWWEIDPTWSFIRLLMALGLAKDVALPSPVLAAKFNSGAPRLAPDDVAPAATEPLNPLVPGLDQINEGQRATAAPK